MDSEFEWREEYCLGVDIIDKEHQRLFKIINKLHTFKDEEKNSQWACQEGIKFFKTHAVKHFADEEAYMSSIGYEGLERHKLSHQGFRETTLPALEEELEKSDYSPSAVNHFLGVCAGWLIGHTLTEDMAITGKRAGKWENLLPGEEITSLQKVIIQLVFDMFHLESQVISDAYSGEKFGNGVYYRLVYNAEQGKGKQEVFMVFEESLLINTVGKILGIETNKLDAMLIHAARYTTRQFVERVMENFPAIESRHIVEEDLLTYSQFQKVFEKDDMQASLLFDTGAGYFAFCVIAPHLLKTGVGTPIKAETAMDEVEKYLSKREKQQKSEASKPKILVVDDSATIRENMKRLLSADYEVALAESGVAAIRTITLTPPDLVLLDYEMPVCDGRQTLEMLRSEPSFADTPVIFLTGRRDTDSMIKVMSLKPAGYLLKHLKPQEIKQKVDEFFAQKQS